MSRRNPDHWRPAGLAIDRRLLLSSTLGALAATTRARAAPPLLEVFEIESRALGRRRLSVYRPPGWRSDQRYPVIYAADGQALHQGYAADLDRLIREGGVRPIVLAGLWASEARDGRDVRALEYLVGSDDSGRAFRRHQSFFLDEVMPFAEGRLGAAGTREDRMLFGFSNGAAWAASMALGHADLFGRAALFSFGWPPAGEGAGRPDRPGLFLLAGTREPAFLAATRRLNAVAHQSPKELVLHVRDGVHGAALWRSAFPEALAWAFGAAATT
jgi:enterochelin esterase-like enzyme